MKLVRHYLEGGISDGLDAEALHLRSTHLGGVLADEARSIRGSRGDDEVVKGKRSHIGDELVITSHLE